MQKTEEFCVDESGWIHCPFCKCRTRKTFRYIALNANMKP